jgi:hypothetical protein
MPFDDPNTIELLQQQIRALQELVDSKDTAISSLQTLCKVLMRIIERHGWPPK